MSRLRSLHLFELIPRHMIRELIISSIGVLSIISCHSDKQKDIPVNFGTEIYDSTALHIALTPNRESFPIYYAQSKGYYKKIGLNLQIATYTSQLECDTAILGKFADGGTIDHTRLKSYGKRASHLDVLWKANIPLDIFTSNTLRIYTAKNLSGRTIGITRQSINEYALTQVLDKAHIALTDVYCPQINNEELRTDMLTGNQIDAAVLSWPYSSLAYALKHHHICSYKDSNTNLYFVRNRMTTSNPRTKKQWILLEKGRRMAIDSLKTASPKEYSEILQKEYGLPKETADTLKF